MAPALTTRGWIDKFLPRRSDASITRPGAALVSDDSRPSLLDNAPDHMDEAALARVMRVVPLGAALLAGSAVALIVIGWLLIYLLVFIPRGTVG